MQPNEWSAAGTVIALWRYPVKSMLGETLTSAPVTEVGIDGDRSYAVVDPSSGRVLSAKREPALFQCRARLEADGSVVVSLSDGSEHSIDDPTLVKALSDLLGRPVVISADKPEAPRIEMGETSATIEGEASEFRGRRGTFFDSAPVHMVTTSSLDALRTLVPDAQVDERRFRPNFVVRVDDPGFVEEEWVGRRVQVGDRTELHVLRPCSRCVMVTHAQEDLPREKTILQTVARRNENNLGVLARVQETGLVSVGDEVFVGPDPRTR